MLKFVDYNILNDYVYLSFPDNTVVAKSVISPASYYMFSDELLLRGINTGAKLKWFNPTSKKLGTYTITHPIPLFATATNVLYDNVYESTLKPDYVKLYKFRSDKVRFTYTYDSMPTNIVSAITLLEQYIAAAKGIAKKNSLGNAKLTSVTPTSVSVYNTDNKK